MQAIDYTKPSLKEYSDSSLKKFTRALKEQFQLILNTPAANTADINRLVENTAFFEC